MYHGTDKNTMVKFLMGISLHVGTVVKWLQTTECSAIVHFRVHDVTIQGGSSCSLYQSVVVAISVKENISFLL